MPQIATRSDTASPTGHVSPRTDDGLRDGLSDGLSDPLQADVGGLDVGGVQQAASAGIGGGGSSLPHLDRIQQSFGRHDVRHVQAHTDGAARAACDTMGANAFATGSHVAFGGKRDLHTAAHEAAHVVQQQGGVQLSGGVGQRGDRYERHADQVADKVVRGESAEGLLDRFAGGTGGTGVQGNGLAVQADVGFEFQTFGSMVGFYEPVLDDQGEPTGTVEKLNDHGTYAGGRGWHLDNDGGDIEVVTDPFPETKTGRSSIGAVFGEVGGFFDELRQKEKQNFEILRKKSKKPNPIKGLHLADDMFETDDNDENYIGDVLPTERFDELMGENDGEVFVLLDKAMKAHPQVTVGIRIDKLFDLFEALAGAKNDGPRTIEEDDDLDTKKGKLANTLGAYKTKNKTTRRHHDTIKETVKGVKEQEGIESSAIKGFLTLVAQYVVAWRKNVDTKKNQDFNNYAKNYLPVMGRTDLVSAFYTLDEGERATFRSMVEDDLAGLMKPFGLQGKDLDLPLFGELGFEDVKGDGNEVTVREFFTELVGYCMPMSDGEDLEVTGHDITSGYTEDDDEESDGPVSVGGLGPVTDIGFSETDMQDEDDDNRDLGRTRGVVVELRRLRENVPFSGWADFARAALDLTVAINEGEDSTGW